MRRYVFTRRARFVLRSCRTFFPVSNKRFPNTDSDVSNVEYIIGIEMGLADRDYFQEDSYAKERRVRRHRSITTLVIIANVAIFLLDHSTGGALTRYMCLAGSVADQPSQWYRCLTYGFVHDSSGFMHIFCNMLTLFFFGPPLERLYGRKEFLIFYLGSIIFSGIVWNVLHVDARAIAIGASGGIAAVVVLFACKFPRNIVLLYGVIPLPVWLLGVLYIVYDAFGASHGGDNIAHDVHLAGSAFALFYFFTGIQFTKLFSKKNSQNKAGGFFDRSDSPRDDGAKRVNITVRSDFDRKGKAKEWDRESLEKEVDRILLKYNRSGKESLTPEEEETLRFASEAFQKWKN